MDTYTDKDPLALEVNIGDGEFIGERHDVFFLGYPDLTAVSSKRIQCFVGYYNCSEPIEVG